MAEQRNYIYDAEDESGTERLATHLAKASWPGMVIALDGELGAGKTKFTQLFAQALGIQEVVNSPTFTIIKEYETARLPLYHMDVYRLTSDEADELGLEEYYDGDGICIVEWASRIRDDMPNERLEIHITHPSQSSPRAQLQAGSTVRHLPLQASSTVQHSPLQASSTVQHSPKQAGSTVQHSPKQAGSTVQHPPIQAYSATSPTASPTASSTVQNPPIQANSATSSTAAGPTASSTARHFSIRAIGHQYIELCDRLTAAEILITE